jgi:hypothetical protein
MTGIDSRELMQCSDRNQQISKDERSFSEGVFVNYTYSCSAH